MEDKNKNEKFVPAYTRTQNDNRSNENVGKDNYNSKKEKKFKSKISKIILILIIIAIVCVIAFYIYKFVINNLNETNVNYLENMKSYGFDVMYDNKSAEPTETVTKSEAIKMVVTSMLNESDITKIIEINEYVPNYQDTMTEEQIEESLEYKNQLWVDYAVSVGIIQKGEITSENANDIATFLDALVYFSNAKLKILNEILDTESIPNIKNYDTYKTSEQLALSDMMYNGLIDEKVNGLKSTLTKERLNKLLIDMVLEYNTITVNGEKININKDKEPTNASEYPYTLASIDKSVYELKNYVVNDSYKNAKESYVDMKKYYYAINSFIQDYANLILNIDYANLNETEFTDSILDLSFYYEDSDNVKEYIEYVKLNKIKMTGNAKVQYPAIYFDGDAYRVRVKVEYKIESADKKENLIYGDLKSKENITYEKNEDSIIVDVPIKKSLINDIVYIELRPLNNIKAGNVKSDENSLKQEVIEQDGNRDDLNENGEIPIEEEVYTDSQIIQEGDKIIVMSE